MLLLSPRLLRDDAEDFFLAHDEIFLAVHLDFLARIFAEQDGVAFFHVERRDLAVLLDLAFADRDHLPLLRLFLGRVRDDDAADLLLALFNPQHDYAVVQGADAHLCRCSCCHTSFLLSKSAVRRRHGLRRDLTVLTASNRPDRLLSLLKGGNRVKQSMGVTANGLARPSDPVFGDFPGDGVAVDTHEVGRVSDIALGALQRAGDEHLLEFPARIVVVHALVEHFGDEPIHLLSHGATRVLDPTGAGTLRRTSRGCGRSRRPAARAPAAACSSGSLPGSRARTACRSWGRRRPACTGLSARTARNRAS